MCPTHGSDSELVQGLHMDLLYFILRELVCWKQNNANLDLCHLNLEPLDYKPLPSTLTTELYSDTLHWLVLVNYRLESDNLPKLNLSSETGPC